MKKDENTLDKSLKTIARTSFIVFVGVFLSKFFTYLYRIIIARYFGAEIYGIFSIATMIFGIFVAIASLGLAEGLLRYVSIYRAKNQTYKIRYLFFRASFVLLITGIISSVILFFSAEIISMKLFHNSDVIIFLKSFSIVITVYMFSWLFLSIIRAYEKISAYSFIFNILQNLTKLLVLLLLVILGLKANSIIFSFIIGTIAVLLLAYYYCRKNLKEIFFKPKGKQKPRALFREVFSYSWPIMLFGIVSSIFYWIDSFSIGYFKGVESVGFYNAAVPLASLLVIASEIFIQLFFPMITKYYSKGNKLLIEQLSKQVSKWIWIIDMPILAMLLIFPGVVINIFFGPQYLVAENALRFLSIATLFYAVFVVSNNLLSMVGKSKLILFDIILASIINLLLNWLLVPMPTLFGLDNSLGITGASIATMISLIFMNLLFLFQAKHYTSVVPLKRKMIGVFFIALFLTIILSIAKSFFAVNFFNMILLGIIFVIAYILLIVYTGCLDRNDVMIIKSVKNKIFSKN